MRFDHELAIADPFGDPLGAEDGHQVAGFERDNDGILTPVRAWRHEHHVLAFGRDAQVEHRLARAELGGKRLGRLRHRGHAGHGQSEHGGACG